MTKETLIFVSILAAGLVTARGQVSYANVIIAPGYNLLANPLNTGITNGANEIMAPIDGEQILTWDGSGFLLVAYDLAFGGWTDGNVSPNVPPSLPPGKGFFLFNPGPATNLTFTGRIILGPGTTNSINLASGYSLIGSLLPATVSNITSAPVNLPIIDGMQILTWTNGAYVYSSYDSGFGGWIGKDFNPKTPPSYSVGQGFFLFNPGPPRAWEQYLP